jgi:hypothetical protein
LRLRCFARFSAEFSTLALADRHLEANLSTTMIVAR